MGQYKPAQYYDRIYHESAEYAKPASQSQYLQLWQAVARMMQQCPVLDLGCGSGQFAEFIMTQTKILKYAGLDFSQVAVNQAWERLKNKHHDAVAFFCADIRDTFDTEHIIEMLGFREQGQFQITCLETLEHMNDGDDLKLLDDLAMTIGVGTHIVITVPTFDDPAHVRHFKSIQEVKDRYESTVKFLDYEEVKHGDQVRWLALSGTLQLP